MIEKFIERFDSKRAELLDKFSNSHPNSYQSIVETLVEAITDEEYGSPDPENIKRIDYGDYQGTLVFIISSRDYQPSNFWITKVNYGSCGACDTLQGIRDESGWGEDKPTDSQAQQYLTLALHLLQRMKEV